MCRTDRGAMVGYVEGYGKESALKGRAGYVAIKGWIDVAMGLNERMTQVGGVGG